MRSAYQQGPPHPQALRFERLLSDIRRRGACCGVEIDLQERCDPSRLKHAGNRRRVAVKPNKTWASQDDTTGITQLDTLRAVLGAIKRHDPQELIVTGGAGAAETDDVFRVGGLTVVEMRFPALSLREAIGRFTEAAYGRRLDFEHA